MENKAAALSASLPLPPGIVIYFCTEEKKKKNKGLSGCQPNFQGESGVWEGQQQQPQQRLGILELDEAE